MGIVVSKKSKERAQTFGHILAGTVVLLHGLEEFEKHELTFGIIYTVFGTAFLALALLHRRLEERIPEISVYFFVIEGIVLFITGFKYLHEHKVYLPYAYFAAGLMYIVLSYVFHRKKYAGKKES